MIEWPEKPSRRGRRRHDSTTTTQLRISVKSNAAEHSRQPPLSSRAQVQVPQKEQSLRGGRGRGRGAARSGIDPASSPQLTYWSKYHGRFVGPGLAALVNMVQNVSTGTLLAQSIGMTCEGCLEYQPSRSQRIALLATHPCCPA